MKSIPLTDKQKNKLIEMLEYAFPNYTVIYIPISVDADHDFGVVKFIGKDTLEHIHWFELCMTKLPAALDISFSQDMNDAEEYMWSWDEHDSKMVMFDQFKKDEGNMNIYYKDFHIVDALYYVFTQNKSKQDD